MSSNQCMYLLPKTVYEKLASEGDDNIKNTLASGQLRQLNNLDVHDGGRVVIRNDDHYKRAEQQSTNFTQMRGQARQFPTDQHSTKHDSGPDPNLEKHFRQDHSKGPKQPRESPDHHGRPDHQSEPDRHTDRDDGDNDPPREPKKSQKQGSQHTKTAKVTTLRLPTARVDKAVKAPSITADVTAQPGAPQPGATQPVANQTAANHNISNSFLGDESLNWDGSADFGHDAVPARSSSPLIEPDVVPAREASMIIDPVEDLAPTPPIDPTPPAANTRSRTWLGPQINRSQPLQAITRASISRERLRSGLASLPKKVRTALTEGDILSDHVTHLTPRHRSLYDNFMRNFENRGRATINLPRMTAADIQEYTDPDEQRNLSIAQENNEAMMKRARDKAQRDKARQQYAAITHAPVSPVMADDAGMPLAPHVEPEPADADMPPPPVVPADVDMQPPAVPADVVQAPAVQVPEILMPDPPPPTHPSSKTSKRFNKKKFREFVKNVRKSGAARVNLKNLSPEEIQTMMDRLKEAAEIASTDRGKRAARRNQAAVETNIYTDVLSNAIAPPNIKAIEMSSPASAQRAIEMSHSPSNQRAIELTQQAEPKPPSAKRQWRVDYTNLNKAMAKTSRSAARHPFARTKTRYDFHLPKTTTAAQKSLPALTWLGQSTTSPPMPLVPTISDRATSIGRHLLPNATQPKAWLGPTQRQNRKRSLEEFQQTTTMLGKRRPSKKAKRKQVL